MTYTIVRVDGDYFVLRSDADGSESLLARALLPDADEGDRVRYENFMYEVI